MDTIKTTRFKSYGAKACPIEASLELFSGKGKAMILFHLLEGTLRFNELKRRIGTVSQRVFTKQLRELESDGLIHREVFAEVPPRVEYSLTETGRTLEPILLAMMDWGIEHAIPILDERKESNLQSAADRGEVVVS